MAHDAFICHSAKDKTTADAVCAMLESNGVRCWIAPRDVTAGMEWSECIIDAIEECRVMVLVFTTNANESSQIRREVERAVNRGVAILPLRIDDILPGRALEYFIGNVHWLDALTPPLESHLQHLAGTVKILLGRLPQHVAPGHTAVIPLAVPEPPKIEWVERTYPRVVESTPPEVFRESPVHQPEPPQVATAPPPPAPPPPTQQVRQQPAEVRSSADAAPPAPKAPVVTAGVAATEKLKRPIGVMAVAVLNFIFAGLMVLAFSGSGNYERNKYGMWIILLGISAVAAGYGLIKLKSWGRLLGIALPSIGVISLISEAAEASRDVSGFMLWLALLAFFGAIVWYMFTRKVKLAFGVSSQNTTNFGAAVSAVPAAQNFSAGLFAKGAGRRPTGVLVVAILSFIESCIWIIPISDAINHERVAPKDFGAFLLVCAAALTGYGLIKLMGWARLLKVVIATVDVILMISVAQDAFREGGFGEIMWIVMLIFIIWSALFMFTPRVKKAFSSAN
jgi:TIR domain-containing protein